MNKVVIIGAGFGGLSAARRLSLYSRAVDVTMLDRKRTSDFLPMLPDCLGRGIAARCLAYPIEDMCRRAGARFINKEVISVDVKKREVATADGALNYDYLIIASGSETNFYGNDNIRNNACKLDDADDAERLLAELRGGKYGAYIIAGGGYTGVEAATNIRRFLKERGRSGSVIIVERAPSILGALPEWMKNYVSDNLKVMDVDVIAGAVIESAGGRRVSLSGGKAFDDALLIWTAGVKTAGFIQKLDVKKSPQGRIYVDEFLRIDERSYVVGDAAYAASGGGYLRMAVQFAIAQGNSAAGNIIASVNGRPSAPYKPLDLGYVIPMANDRSCGSVLGMDLKGLFPTMLHFIMCVYRSWGRDNKACVLKGILKKGGHHGSG